MKHLDEIDNELTNSLKSKEISNFHIASEDLIDTLLVSIKEQNKLLSQLTEAIEALDYEKFLNIQKPKEKDKSKKDIVIDRIYKLNKILDTKTNVDKTVDVFSHNNFLNPTVIAIVLWLYEKEQTAHDFMLDNKNTKFSGCEKIYSLLSEYSNMYISQFDNPAQRKEKFLQLCHTIDLKNKLDTKLPSKIKQSHRIKKI